MKRKSIMAIALAGACLLSLTACSPLKAVDKVEVKTETVDKVPEESQAEDTETETQETATEAEAEVFNLAVDSSLMVNGQELTYSAVYPNGEDCWQAYAKLTYGEWNYQSSEQEYTAEWICDGYVRVDSADSFTVFAVNGYSNDWASTSIIRFDEKTGFTEGGFEMGSITSTDEITGDTITLHNRADVFGTFGTNITYDISGDSFERVDPLVLFENNVTHPDGDYYTEEEWTNADALDFQHTCWDDYGRCILTVKTGFTAQDADGNDYQIKAGDILYPYAYNPDDQVFYFTFNDQIYSFSYDAGEDGYGLSIDGVDEYDIFVNLSYAG